MPKPWKADSVHRVKVENMEREVEPRSPRLTPVQETTTGPSDVASSDPPPPVVEKTPVNQPASADVEPPPPSLTGPGEVDAVVKDVNSPTPTSVRENPENVLAEAEDAATKPTGCERKQIVNSSEPRSSTVVEGSDATTVDTKPSSEQSVSSGVVPSTPTSPTPVLPPPVSSEPPTPKVRPVRNLLLT